MKLLIVDDSLMNLMMVEGHVKAMRMVDQVLLCSEPANATQLIENEGVDIVFLDIVMPGKSGLDVLREIRQKPALDDVQVIMLTSKSDAAYFKQSFELGANDFLKKPVDVIELQARLQSAIKARRNLLLLGEVNRNLMAQNADMLSNYLKKSSAMLAVYKQSMEAIRSVSCGECLQNMQPIMDNLSAMEARLHIGDFLTEVEQLIRHQKDNVLIFGKAVNH